MKITRLASLWLTSLMVMTGALVAPAALAGQYNLCIDASGRHSYTQDPCPTGQKSIVRQYESTPPPKADDSSKPADTTNRISTENPQYQAVRDGNRQRELERRLLQLQRQLADSEQKMAAELQPMEADRDAIAGNNKTNRRAVVELSIADTRSRYQKYQDYVRSQIDEVNKELAALKARNP